MLSKSADIEAKAGFKKMMQVHRDQDLAWHSVADRKFSTSSILGCKLTRVICGSVLCTSPGRGKAV